MDFHSLKRKKLQSLCKKHGIPANKTNLQMADLLTAALAPKEKDNSIPVEDINERNSEDEQKNYKKVRFSPDIETREYEPSGYKKEAERTSRTSTLTTSSLKESVDNRRRGRGKGNTRQPQAKADKEVSSVMESDGVENVNGGEARMVRRRLTRTGATFRDSDLVNIGVVNRNTRSKAQSVASISAIERKDEVFGATVKTSSKGVARATSKRNSVSHLDVPVENRQVVLKESNKRQKVTNLDVVTEDKASSETNEQNEKALPPVANPRASRRKSIMLNPNNVAEESASDKAMLKLKPLHEKATRKENDVVKELRRSNRRASVYGENEKALPPAANLLAARRKSIVLKPNNVAEESASDEAVEKLKPLHEKAIRKENNVVKELRRSNRRASVYGGVTMSTEVNKIAGKVAQVKDISESVQKAETTMVVSESLFVNPSRVSSRYASKMKQKAITGVSIMTTETARDLCQSSEKFAVINDDSVLDTDKDGIVKGGADNQCGSSEKCANLDNNSSVERNLEEFQAEVWDTEDGADKRSNKVQKNDVENDRISGVERSEYDESTDEVQLAMETPNMKESFQVDCKTFLHFEKDNIQDAENKETVALGGNACDASELTGRNQAELEDGKGIFEFVREEKEMNRRQHDFASGEGSTFPPILLSSSSKWVVHRQAKNSSCSDSYHGRPEMEELLHSPKQPNGKASYEQLDGEMEEDEIIMGGDGRVQISDEGAKNPTDNPSLGNDAKDHDELAIEQLNAHSDAFSEGVSIDDDGVLELSCERKTEIQPMEAGREQCPSELCDEVVTIANSKPTADTKDLDAISPFKGKTSDAVGDSSCHESEAFELNLFFEEGESTVEKAYPVNLGSFAEASSTESNVKDGCTANFIVEPQAAEQFEEMKKTEAVIVDKSHAITASAVHQDSEFTAEGERTIEKDGVIHGVERNKQDGRVDEEDPGQLGHEAHHRNASLVVGAETIMADTQDMSDGAIAYPNKMQGNHVEHDRFSDLERTKHDESTDEVQLEVEVANAKDRFEDFASSEALSYHETTRFSFNCEENDVPEEKQADANDVPEEKQADVLPQSFMDELEDGKVSYIAVAKNTSDEICEKDVVDGMGNICAREVGDSDVGEPLLSEAMDAPSFPEPPSYQLNSYEDTYLKIHVESFFTNMEDKDPSDGNLTSNNLVEAMHVEQNHCEESELTLEDNLKSEGLGCTELSEDNAAGIERFKQDMQLDKTPLPGIDKPTYIGAPGDISSINQEFVDLQKSKDNIAADSSDQSIAIYGPDILKEQANISHCGDQGISENEVCEKHKDSRVATGKINVLQEPATYKAFDGQLEDEIIRIDDGRVQESDVVANNPTDNPTLGDDARDHDEVANEQHNVHSDTLSEEVFTDNSFLNELSCENETEIQPTEAGGEQCLPELGDRETAANSEKMADTKKLDAAVSPFKGKTAEAVVGSSCHESEAFDLDSIFEEGEYVAEKQVSMVDGSVPENKTEIQSTEAGREQSLPELGDRVLTAVNYEQMADTKNLDAVSPFKGKTTEAVGDSSCHETEAFELNLFFEEGEHVVEKQGVEAFPVNLVSMDGGSFPENMSSMLIDEEAERGYTANSIVEGVQEVTERFEEMQTTEAVMVDQPHALAVSADQEVTAEEGKSCQLKLQSAKQTSDHTENDKHNVCCESLSFSAMKRTSRSDLILCTPQKFAEPSTMKENAPSLKTEQRTSLTDSRMSRKRRPLGDLRN